MHVVFVDRAGAKSILELLGHIAAICLEQGWRVTFVMWDDGRQTHTQGVLDGVDVFIIRVPPKRHLWDLVPQHIMFAREFRKLLRHLQPDIVHTNFAVPSIVARWVAARERVPCIVSTQHELYGSMYPHYRLGLRLTERYCSAIVYVSCATARSFGREDTDAKPDRQQHGSIHAVISNGVDVGKIRTTIANAGDRVPGRIVCAGRMVSIKGQWLLIEAMPEVVRSHSHLQLHLIGSGPMESELRQRVDELGMSEYVTFLGWRTHDEVLCEMATAELVVVPSSQEGFGLAVAEALVCGTPLLVSDIPAFREVLEGFAGQSRFVAPGDTTVLTNELVQFPFTKIGDKVVLRSVTAADVERLSSHTMAAAYLNLYQVLPCGGDE